ncbi:MAG: radical SAM protein [Candidatus Omnitrophota bacterium]
MIPLRNFNRFFYKTLKQPGYAFRVLCKRFWAGVSYWLGFGRSSMPEAVTLFLTHRCNLRCKMCGQWGEGGVTKNETAEIVKQELTQAQARAVIDDLARYGSNITLFGGEPLLFPGCVDLISYIKRKGLHCLMITNGSLLLTYAEGIVDAGLDELNLSLDGGQELHDRIRGMDGLFVKIMDGIERVNYFKEIKGAIRPLINLQCTINEYNYRDLDQLLDVARGMKANSLTFHNLIFLSKDILSRQSPIDASLGCSSKDWQGFVFDPGIDPDELYEKIRQIKSRTFDFSVDFYPNFGREELRRYYRDLDFRPKGCNCSSPWIVAYVFPDGEVRPCLNFSYSFGNVKEARFSSLWNNAKAVRYRRQLKKCKVFPVCVRCTELYRY